MKRYRLCATPGCRNQVVPVPVVCDECRGGGEREAPRLARERTDAGGGSRPRSLRRSGPRTMLDGFMESEKIAAKVQMCARLAGISDGEIELALQHLQVELDRCQSR